MKGRKRRRNRLNDEAVAIDDEGVRRGRELFAGGGIETVNQLVDLRAVEAQRGEEFVKEAEGGRRLFEIRNRERKRLRTQGTVPLCFVNFAQRGQSPCATPSAPKFVIDLFGLGEIGGGAGDVIRGGGRKLIEKGNQTQTDFVAEDIIDEVGGVGDVVLADGIEVLEDVLAADAEQRTDNVAIAGTDASQTVNACTAEKVHQESLHRIVTMMGDTDSLGPDILT